jgi:GcrA cell cycle regulator
MNEQITPPEMRPALHEKTIGPPTEADAADMDGPVLKPGKRKLITTIALTIDTCRWPLGDPAASDFHYCGKLPLIGRPYCDVHDAKSYQGGRSKKAAA